MGQNLNPLGASLKARAASGAGGDSLPTVPLPIEPVKRTWSAATDLYSYIAERGFFYPQEVVSRYLISLRSSPMTLFSGIPGTGKTKLALLTAEYFAWSPGTSAVRLRRPDDSDSVFHVRIDKDTLRSGTLTPTREQFDYFNVPVGGSDTFTVNITNVLGAQGDMTFRAHNHIYAGRRHLSISVPVSVRRSFESIGVQEGDYLSFEIVEEFKRYRVSLLRPEREEVDERPENRYAFVSVRPEWKDHTALLGEWDDEYERYMRTPVLELMLRARREEQAAIAQDRVPAPYFLILDEMNIAAIEHYFSDFLSALESRRYDADGSIRQEAMNLHDASTRVTWMDDDGVEYEIPPRLAIPTNLLITGTVNDDRSTFDLSPKVLDRANTMEFSAVDFDAFLGLAADDLAESAFSIPPDVTRRLDLGQLELGSQAESQRMRAQLMPLLEVNAVLEPVNLHFGYRVLNEVALFLTRTYRLVGEGPDVTAAAIDIQILQKVLPRLFELQSDASGVLATLLWQFCTGAPPEAVPDRARLLGALEVEPSGMVRYHPELLQRAISPVRAVPEPAGGTVTPAPLAAAPEVLTSGMGMVEAVFPRSAARLWRMLGMVA